MDKCCDFCGNAGAIGLLITCSRCKSCSQHVYCMRPYPKVGLESWYCEECEGYIRGSSSNTPGKLQCGSVHPTELPNDVRLNSIKWGKKIQTRKVKFLSPQEAIMLKPGSPSPIRCTRRFIPKSHQVTQMRPPTAEQQETEPSRGLRDGGVSSNLEIEIANPLSAIPFPMDDKSFYTPASDSCWSGRFNVLVGEPKEWEISCSIQAHPASRVRRKVYESSRLMPEVLECELLQRGSLWMSLFGNHCPDIKDIGLYFFPSNPKRCKNYVSLLEHMGEKDLVLRQYADGRELLIFTSQFLPMECQRWDGKYFFWGVFRHTKLVITSIPEEECHDEVNNMKTDMMGEENAGRSDHIVLPTGPLLLPKPEKEEETFPEFLPVFKPYSGQSRTPY